MPPLPDDDRQRSELSKAADADSVVIFDGGQSVLPDGGDHDLVATRTKLLCQQAALDLRSANERRVVISCEEDAH